jgi:hypothetical protein
MGNNSVQQRLIAAVLRDIITFIVEDTGAEIESAMEQFYTSEVFGKLQNIETGLYSESPAYVYHLYKIERQYGRLVQLEV